MDDAGLKDLLERVERIEGTEALDEILNLLSDRYIRYTLYYLSEHTATTIDTLTDVIAGWEAIETGTIISSETHRRIRIRLYHVTLPKLDYHDYVDFDTDDYTIKQSEKSAMLTPLLDNLFDTNS